MAWISPPSWGLGGGGYGEVKRDVMGSISVRKPPFGGFGGWGIWEASGNDAPVMFRRRKDDRRKPYFCQATLVANKEHTYQNLITLLKNKNKVIRYNNQIAVLLLRLKRDK
jgi:hypothetical protein